MWLRRWLRRPNSEAHTRLHCGHLGPDVRSAAECVLPSLAWAATFVTTSHVLYNAPSSTNVIVGVDGLLQGKARQGCLSICRLCTLIWELNFSAIFSPSYSLAIRQLPCGKSRTSSDGITPVEGETQEGLMV